MCDKAQAYLPCKLRPQVGYPLLVFLPFNLGLQLSDLRFLLESSGLACGIGVCKAMFKLVKGGHSSQDSASAMQNKRSGKLKCTKTYA